MNSSDSTSATWRKATYSNAQASCVEAGSAAGRVLVRDTTQHGNGPVVRISPADWRRFTASMRQRGLAKPTTQRQAPSQPTAWGLWHLRATREPAGPPQQVPAAGSTGRHVTSVTLRS